MVCQAADAVASRVPANQARLGIRQRRRTSRWPLGSKAPAAGRVAEVPCRPTRSLPSLLSSGRLSWLSPGRVVHAGGSPRKLCVAVLGADGNYVTPSRRPRGRHPVVMLPVEVDRTGVWAPVAGWGVNISPRVRWQGSAIGLGGGGPMESPRTALAGHSCGISRCPCVDRPPRSPRSRAPSPCRSAGPAMATAQEKARARRPFPGDLLSAPPTGTHKVRKQLRGRRQPQRLSGASGPGQAGGAQRSRTGSWTCSSQSPAASAKTRKSGFRSEGLVL